MREKLLEILLNPNFWGFCVVAASVVVHRFFPGGKVQKFLDTTVPALFHEVEQLEKDGIISKSDKLGTFLDKFLAAAQSQNVVLTLSDLLHAKTVVTGLAQSNKPATPATDETITILRNKLSTLEAKK